MMELVSSAITAGLPAVTEKIVNLLEQGVVPSRRPWTGGGLPRNVASKKRAADYILGRNVAA